MLSRFLSLTLLLGAACCWADSPSALESDRSGWKDITPNAALKGWTRQAFLAKDPMNPVSQWHVDPATHYLVCDGDKGHEWLRYDHEYANVIFHVEFRFTKIEGKTGYNSGVFVRNDAKGEVWHQVQVGEQTAGWVLGNTPIGGEVKRFRDPDGLKEQRVKPAGEWNTYEVRAEGPKLTVWVNGGITAERAGLEVLKGYVGLEAEGYRIEFRNLKVKELK